MKVLLLVLAALLFLAAALMRPGDIAHGPGVLAPDEPEQGAADGRAPFAFGDYRLKPLASFELEARVLSRKDYHFDREADLAPLDLALGWGPMSDTAVLERLDIRQGSRFFFWRTEDFPIPRREIERNAANMHIIPADESVADALDEVRPGHVVSLAGLLVEARGDDGWRWKSSLTRGDTGNGACELFYVESVDYR